MTHSSHARLRLNNRGVCCTCSRPVLAQSDASRQRSTSIGFGAQRTLTKPCLQKAVLLAREQLLLQLNYIHAVPHGLFLRGGPTTANLWEYGPVGGNGTFFKKRPSRKSDGQGEAPPRILISPPKSSFNT